MFFLYQLTALYVLYLLFCNSHAQCVHSIRWAPMYFNKRHNNLLIMWFLSALCDMNWWNYSIEIILHFNKFTYSLTSGKLPCFLYTLATIMSRWSDLDPKWVRLVPNGTNPGIFRRAKMGGNLIWKSHVFVFLSFWNKSDPFG